MRFFLEKMSLLFLFVTFFLCSLCYMCDTDTYLISTKSCKIPDLPTVIPTDNPSSLEYLPFDCGSGSILRSFVTHEEEGDKHFLRVEKVATRDKECDGEFKCCYSYVRRNGSQELPDVGISFSEWQPFENPLELTQSTVKVWCIQKHQSFATTEVPVYQNVHQIVKLDGKLKEKAENLKETWNNGKAISVLFIVIDGVSRLNFIRTMPKTEQFIAENGFLPMKGYSKIADNTYPNFMAWLTGIGKNESSTVCNPYVPEGLKKCPMLWYTYQNLGYITAYAEDWAVLNTFNYFKKGFKDPPTDFYFRPYFEAASTLDTKIVDTMPYCTGPEIEGQRVLNLATDFSKATKNMASFGVFWMNTFSHNNRNTTRRMDGNVKEAFETLKNDGVLDEKVVILLSDHGNRYGDLIGTGRGFFEERMPMLYVSLPPWFKTKYPQETQLFEENSNKLTSTFDLYQTLQHLLVLSGVNGTIEQSKACPTCKSLFEELPDDRSCENAGIPVEWCSCIGLVHKKEASPELAKNLIDLLSSGNFSWLKERSHNNTQENFEIKDLQEVLKSEPKMDNDDLVKYYYYLVRFRTSTNETFQVVFTEVSEVFSNPKIIHKRKVYW